MSKLRRFITKTTKEQKPNEYAHPPSASWLNFYDQVGRPVYILLDELSGNGEDQSFHTSLKVGLEQALQNDLRDGFEVITDEKEINKILMVRELMR